MDYFFTLAELIGTVAFALSGALKAIQKNLDIFGVCFLALFTALGGGVIRDLLLGRTPPRLFESEGYILVAIGVAVAAFLAVRFVHRKLDFGIWGDRIFNLCDALGLGIFAVIGTQSAAQAGLGDKAFLSIFLGMTTGVGGGVLRDLMCCEIPSVLRKHIYAVAAICGSLVYYVLTALGVWDAPATLAGVAVVVALRLLARHYQWNLPRALKETPKTH